MEIKKHAIYMKILLSYFVLIFLISGCAEDDVEIDKGRRRL